MTSIYIQTNILLALAWVLFQLLPLKRVRFRTAKVIAQSLLVSSIVIVPVLASLPDFSFAELSQQAQVAEAVDVDGAATRTLKLKSDREVA